MADYIFEVPLTDEGRDATDQDVIDMMITKASSLIPAITYDNLSMESVRVDKETKKIYYNIIASPAMKMGLGSLNVAERLAWYDILVAGVAVAGAIACLIIGSVPVAIGLAVVAGIALVREPISGLVEAMVNDTETKQAIAEAVADGRITPDEGDNLLNGVNDSWGSEIPWTKIIIGGMIGLGVLAGLYIFTKR